MPNDSVNNITVNESNFCLRNLSKKLMGLTYSSAIDNGCRRGFSGFTSTRDNPARDESRARA
jgi:hypothetical protein